MKSSTHWKSILAALALTACASPAQPSDSPTPDPIVAAEHAFAARAAEEGWVPAFRAFAAEDAVILAPTLSNAQQSLAAQEDDGDRSLQWWPTYAGISRSGEFGFSTGPAFSGDQPSRLQYFSVWRRQSDGAWKWIYDGGSGAVDPEPPPRETSPLILIPSARGVGSADRAIEEVRAIEASLSPGASLEIWLAPDARINRGGLAPAIGAADFGRVLNRPALPVTYSTLHAEAAQSGDMVFTLGRARWLREGQEVNAHYARIWQLRGDGWRIVFDQIM